MDFHQFYVDITDEPIRNAMSALNIKEDELKVKPLEFFAGEDISAEIQEIRYNHHLFKSENAKRRIEDYLRQQAEEEELKKLKKSPTKHLTIDKIKKIYNQRIAQFLESEKTSRIQEEKMNQQLAKTRNLEKKTEEKESSRKKKEEVILKHKENLKTIDLARKMQEELTIERLNKLPVTPRVIQTSPRQRRNKVFSLTLEEKEIDYKLQQFHEKINKSAEKYHKNLQDKVETAKNHRKRRNSFNNSLYYDQKLMTITTKYDQAFTRRKKIREEFNEKVNEKEAKFQEIHEKVKKIFKLENEKNIMQGKSLEENEERCEEIIEGLKKKKKDLNEKKSEKTKAMEAGVIQNMQKMKKLEIDRKEKILEKHFQIERKKKELFDKLESENKTIRQKAMKFTIEKEKSQALKFMISKAQTPGDLQKLMEKVQNISNC